MQLLALNMESSHSAFNLISVATIIVAAAAQETRFCCGGESEYLYNDWSLQCENGFKPMIPCNFSLIGTLNAGYRPYIYQPDDDGTNMYVDTIRIVPSPYYCVSNVNTTYRGKMQRQIFLYCIDKGTRRNRPIAKDLMITIVALLFMVSGVFLALTAAIYFFIPQTQDLEGKCTFHLTLNQSLIYLLGSYWAFRLDTMEVTLLEEFCISYWYLFIFAVLAFFVWSAVLAFHLRRRFRRNLRIEESKLKFRYLMIGYGIPTALVVISNIHVYWYDHFRPMDRFFSSCDVHRVTMFVLYAALPILITQVICAFFFVSLQRKLWSAQPSSSPANSPSKLRKFKFRFLLNAKLFVLTGLPCLLIVVCVILAALTNGSRLFVYLNVATFYFIACEGVVVFYMLVLSRKRILHGIAGMFGITLTGWQPCPESEESIAYSNENENENDPSREL